MPIIDLKDLKNSFFLKLITLLIFMSLIGCKNEDVEEELNYKYFKLEKQGWKSKTSIEDLGDVKCKATEVPIQYYILKEQKNKGIKYVDSVYQAHKYERIFEVEFDHKENKDLKKAIQSNFSESQLIEYLSFGITEDFSVYNQKRKEYKCQGVIYEGNGNFQDNSKLILFFSDINPTDTIYLVYKDKLFNSGKLKFRFKETVEKL
jgi:hypothetical protein